jgi:hypothetical protein
MVIQRGELMQALMAAEDQADPETVGVVLTLLPHFLPKVNSPFSFGFGIPRRWLVQAAPRPAEAHHPDFKKGLDRSFIDDFTEALQRPGALDLDLLARAAFVIAAGAPPRRTPAAVYIVEMV